LPPELLSFGQLERDFEMTISPTPTWNYLQRALSECPNHSRDFCPCHIRELLRRHVDEHLNFIAKADNKLFLERLNLRRVGVIVTERQCYDLG